MFTPTITLDALLGPVLTAGGALLLLLLILRLLRRYPRMREITPIYIVGALLLGLALLLDGERWLPGGFGRSLLISGVLVCWGYVLFDLLEDLVFERSLLRRGVSVPRLARDILRGAALAVLLLLAANQIFGVPLSSLVISSTVLSAVLGLALQDLLKNVIGGVALQTERPFSLGDWVRVQGHEAQVVEMNWRATRLVTVDNTHITLPNALLAQAEISNFSSVTPVQAMHAQVALSYQHQPNEVKDVLVAAALAAPGVLSEPRPKVRLVQYGEYSITYDIKFCLTDYANVVDIRDAVMTNAWYFVRRAELRMPFPIHEVLLHQGDNSAIGGQHHAAGQHELETLAGLEIFSVLSEQELLALAERAELRVFGRGEVLVRQGDSDDALFVIRRGAVRVEAVPDYGGAPVAIDALRAGDVFGELALLTGVPRGATVIAEQDTETLIIHRAALAPLLAQNPQLPERLSAVLERRAANRESALAAAAVAGPLVPELTHAGLVAKIRRVFGI